MSLKKYFFLFSSDVFVSTQKLPDCSDLNPDKLNDIFIGLTSTTSTTNLHNSVNSSVSSRNPEESCMSTDYPEESIIADTPQKSSTRFVKNSGLVPYDSSCDSSDRDQTCIEIDSDSDSDDRPPSLVFKIPPKHAPVQKVPVSCFKKPSSKSELEFLSGKTFVKSTDRKISWAANLFRIWRQQRIHEGTGQGEISWCDIDESNLDPEVLSHVLPVFINEIKWADGEDYPPNTVYSIIVMLQLFFEKKGKT